MANKIIRVKDVVETIEKRAPLSLALDFDSAGLNVGSMQDEVKGIMLAENVTCAVIDECKSCGANLLITHHPVVFGEPVNGYMKFVVERAKENGVNLYSCHTNLDCCSGGLNDVVAKKLGMRAVQVVDGCARWGIIKPTRLKDFAKQVAEILGDKCVKYVGIDEKIIQKVAICTGAGGRDEELFQYYANKDPKDSDNVDCIIGGESKLSLALEASDLGIALIDVGHYTSEIACIEIFQDWLAEYDSIIKVSKSDEDPYKSVN